MILVLILLLIVLALFVGQKRGIKAIMALLYNFIIILMSIVFINLGFNIIFCAIIACLLISMVTIFYLNGYNLKTISAFISVIIVMLIMSIILVYFNNKLELQGFSYEYVEEISSYNFNIDLDMDKVGLLVILFATVGAISDTAMCMASAIYEINANKKMNKKALFISGMNVGKDILGTTTNTLFFAFMSGFLGFLIWHSYNDLVTLVNFKDFGSNLLQILCSGIGCIIIIPITSLITVYLLKRKAD